MKRVIRNGPAMTDDLDNLRPEVRGAYATLDTEVSPSGRVSYEAYRAWCTIHAELLRLAGEEYILSKIVQRQAKILTGVANALKGEPGRLHLHSHHDLAEVAQSRVAELAMLKAKIADAPIASVRVDDRMHVSIGARSCAVDFVPLHTKRVRLVVEE